MSMDPSADHFSPNRIAAMVRRYWYLLRSSWPRILDLIYWPTVQMLMWGFLQMYVAQNAGFFARAGGVFIGSVLLWDILFRGQLGFSINFLEEMYAHNLANIMMSPLRPIEFIAALMIMSVVRLSIGMVPVTLLAVAFFGFNLWSLGLALAAFSDFDVVVDRHFRGRPVVAERLGRGKPGLDHNVPVSAAHLRLLSGDGAAALAANRLLVAAAHLCLRRHARAAHPSCVPRRSDAGGFCVQPRAVRGCVIGLHETFAQRAAQRHAAANRRIAENRQ
jgi:hypothetical protein